MPQKPKQTDDFADIAQPVSDDFSDIAEGRGHGASSSFEPAKTLGPMNAEFYTKPIGEYSPRYQEESKKLRSIAAPAQSVKQAEEDVQHPVASTVRRTLAGTEADLGDMLTPLFAATSAVSELANAPGIIGTLARLATRGTTAAFGAKGALDVTEAGTQNTPEAWARRLSGLSQVATAPAAASGLFTPSRGARLSSGAGLQQGEEAVNAIIPEFDKTLKAQGKTEVPTIKEFGALVDDTDGRLETEYQDALKPVENVQISGSTVADAIRDKITPNMLETRDGRLMARELLRRASEFDNGTWTVEKLDLERSKLSKTFRGGKGVSPSSVSAKTKLDASFDADRAANKAINEVLYPLADQAAGKPPGYFKALKQKQSVLSDIRDDVKAAKDTALSSSAQKKGRLLREKINPYSYLNPKHGLLGAGGGLHASGTKFADPLAVANKKVDLAFKPPAPRTRLTKAAKIAAAAESLKHLTTDEWAGQQP